MKKELIYIGSVNKAFKAKETLYKNGIISKIERGISTEDGCGYSILIVDNEKNVAKEILYNNGLIDKS